MNAKRHIKLELMGEKHVPAVESVLERYALGDIGGFRLVGKVVRDPKSGSNTSSLAIKTAKETCTAWRWTLQGGMVGCGVTGQAAQEECHHDFSSVIRDLQAELERERHSNTTIVQIKDREIAKLQKDGAGDSNDGDTVSKRRFERMRMEYMAKCKEVEALKAAIAAKDKEILETKESTEDSIRARAMDTYWRGECERLNLEVESLKSARGDCTVLRGECERLRATVTQFEQTAMGYVHYDIREVDKIKNLKEAYITLALKAGQYQRTGAEERVEALQAEVKALHAAVEAGKHAAEARTVVYCAELERQNRALVEASVDGDADVRMANLRREVDDGRVLEAALRGQVKEGEMRLALVKAEMEARVTKAEAMEERARGVFAAAGGVEKVTGRVHGELAFRYNQVGVPRQDFEEWMNIHRDPVFQLGMDFAGIHARDADIKVKRALADVETVTAERSQTLRQLYDARERCERAEMSEGKARRLLQTYAGERARLVAGQARPQWEAQAHAIVEATREAALVFAALQGEVRALVEKREWCEVLSVKCGSLATEFRRRALRMNVVDGEREFLMKCVPELERAKAGK